MNKTLLTLSFLLFSGMSRGQNLVPNNDFEQIMNPLCFVYGTNLNANVNGWTSASIGSPDLLTDSIIASTCDMTATGSGSYWGPQQPRSGKSMLAIITYCSACASETREYVQAQLTSPLVPGQTYTAEVWVSYADYSMWYTNNIGFHFSTNAFFHSSWTSPAFTPHIVETNTITDSSGWQLVSGTFVADSAYQYVTIGNFNDDLQSTITSNPNGYQIWAVYFLDDVKVEEANLQPTALFNAPHHVCPGTCTEFINLSLNATNYEWTFPGGTPTTSTDTSPTVCFFTPGVYDVTLVASNPNGSDTLTLTNYITVYPMPPVQSIVQSGDTLISTQGFVSYQWFQSGDTIPGATSYYYIALQSGDYSVIGVDGNNCYSEAVILNVTAGMDDQPGGVRTLLVYPNPAHDMLEWSMPAYPGGSLAGAVSGTVYNSLGETVRADVWYNDGAMSGQVNVEALPAGLYMLEIRVDGKMIRNLFIRQ